MFIVTKQSETISHLKQVGNSAEDISQEKNRTRYGTITQLVQETLQLVYSII